MANPMDDCNFKEIEDKAIRAELLRHALPASQPQEGSPSNTFTTAELEELQAALPNMQISGSHKKSNPQIKTDFDICHQAWPSAPKEEEERKNAEEASVATQAPPQEAPMQLDWHGAPDFSLKNVDVVREFRQRVRSGEFAGPTNNICPGFLQCNLVVLPQGPVAFDFLLFCQRNPKACPLIEVCDVGSSCPLGVAPGADLKTDVPM